MLLSEDHNERIMSLIAHPNYKNLELFVQTLSDDTLNIIMIKKDLQLMRDKLRNQEVEIQREHTLWQRKQEACTDQLRSMCSLFLESRSARFTSWRLKTI
jgi:hypothetical protein